MIAPVYNVGPTFTLGRMAEAMVVKHGVVADNHRKHLTAVAVTLVINISQYLYGELLSPRKRLGLGILT